MKPLDPIVWGAPLEAELRAFDRACEARAEVLAMVAAWRVSVGAGPDAPPPEELRACLVVADEECTAAGDAWARAVAVRDGLAAYTLTGKRRTLEELEQWEAAEDAMASADFAPDAELLEERARQRAEAGRDEVGLSADATTSRAGGRHYGDA